MHNNYFFLRKLTPLLETRLKDSVVSECFSQNKEELIIRFETLHAPFFIKANVSPSFSCLSFPDTFHRARKNSVDLFDNLIGQRVQGILQFKNERSFSIQFSNDFELLFKMHGNRSNIILFSQRTVDRVFNNNIQGDLALTLEGLDREIDWSFENFSRHQNNLASVYFTFGKVVWKYLEELDYQMKSMEQKWKIIQDLRQLLEFPTYYISEIRGKLTFSLLPAGKIKREFQDPLKAINDFFIASTQQEIFAADKSFVLAKLKDKLKSCENYLESTSEKLRSLQNDNSYKNWADIIMANLHSIGAGSERVILSDFYHENEPIEIKLKKDFSPQKNAEVYYNKSKKQQLEINRLQRTLPDKEKEMDLIKDQIKKLEGTTDLKVLRSLIDSLSLAKPREKQADPLPYHELEYNGFKILIGKNATSNDKLTMKHSYKEDLWLHAKDSAGSHVLIKYQSGKKFPKEVIERAAQLAAYHSKRKNESLCPVVVTPRKFVRKRKGDPAGTVIVEREEVILVEPKRQ